MSQQHGTRQIVSWALYDWANSAYAVVIMTVFAPLVFKDYWAAELVPLESSKYWGTANSIASLIVAAIAPILGAIADRGGAKKRFLFLFAFLGIVMSGALQFVAQGSWGLALLLFVLATIGFSGSISFYDSLIGSITTEKKVDYVSAFGYALGYLGGGLLFALCVLMVKWYESFGFVSTDAAVRFSFFLVALWWLVFSIPLLIWVKEPPVKVAAAKGNMIILGFRQLAHTFREIRNLRVVFLFLIGYWLYIDGVDTIVRMASVYGKDLGFSNNVLIEAILVTQFVGFPAAILYGKLGERIGPKAGIMIAIAVYIGVVFWGYRMDTEGEFYVLAIVIGLVQGGIQSLSRSLYTRIIPADKAAEFFGFYNMLGKFAAVIGPAMMGWVGALTGDPRNSILSILILFVAGAACLYFVDVEEGKRIARELERV